MKKYFSKFLKNKYFVLFYKFVGILIAAIVIDIAVQSFATYVDNKKYGFKEETPSKNAEIQIDLPGQFDLYIDSVLNESGTKYEQIKVVYGKARIGKVYESEDLIHGINLISASNDTLFIMPEAFTTLPTGHQLDLRTAIAKALRE